MKRTEKAAIVADVRERMARLPNVYLTDFTGLKVKQVTDLRRRFRQAGFEYVVIKNTLAQRALAEAEVAGLDTVPAGPTGWVFADDAIAAAKVIADFQREADSFQVKAGLVDGRAITADEAKALAKLPSRPELLSQLAGALQAPLQAFLGATNGLMYQLAGALEALRSQRSETA
jgi:large subunit ribosomal protein L10